MSLRGARFGTLLVEYDPGVGSIDRKVRVLCDCGERSFVRVRGLYPGRQRCNIFGCTDRLRALARRAAVSS